MNPKVSSYLVSENKTPAIALWLIDRIKELTAAAPAGSAEANLRHGSLGKLQDAHEFYRAHRAQTDAYRTTSHDQLCSSVNAGLMALLQCLNTRRSSSEIVQSPATEERIALSIQQIAGKYAYHCVCCRTHYRSGIEQFDGRWWCKECANKHLSKCYTCGSRHDRDHIMSIFDNNKRAVYPHCNDCLRKANPAVCTDCGNYYSGQPADGHAISAADLVKQYGAKLCYHCGANWRLQECGHVHSHPKKLNIPENIEDDDRDRDGVRDRAENVCPACYDKHRQDEGPEFWNQKQAIVVGASYKEVGSQRSFGVELEVIHPHKMRPMPDQMKAVWTSKTDASLPNTGVEMASTILNGDEGLKVIEELCAYARKHKWATDCRAGFHLHIGLQNEDSSKVAAVVIGYLMTYDMWLSFVAPSRARCKYCRKNSWEAKSLLNFKPNEIMHRITHDPAIEGRRVWCNWHSYLARMTVEIRLHHATLDYEKISNWVKAHARFVDWCCGLTRQQVYDQLNGKDTRQIFLYLAQNAWKDRDLARWFRARAEKLHEGVAPLASSNRTLRKMGLDPTKPRFLMYKGVRTFTLKSGRDWYIVDETNGNGKFLNANGWGRPETHFSTEGKALGFVKAMNKGEGKAYINSLDAEVKISLMPRRAVTWEQVAMEAVPAGMVMANEEEPVEDNLLDDDEEDDGIVIQQEPRPAREVQF